MKILASNVEVKNPSVLSEKGSEFLATDTEFPALPDFLRSSVSGTGSTQPREDN
jgi:hypothetical protein